MQELEITEGIIKSVSGIREFGSDKQIGFTLKESGDYWFNIKGTPEELEKILEVQIIKGYKVKFEYNAETKAITNLTSQKGEDHGWEDDMIPFEELLSLAHKKAEKDKHQMSIETTCVSVDLEKKNALFKCTLRISEGGKLLKSFDAHGDATVENIKSANILPHFIRMAETRAIARALRWYTNNAKCSTEEAQ